jgi:transcriptional regulator of met regulon
MWPVKLMPVLLAVKMSTLSEEKQRLRLRKLKHVLEGGLLCEV